MSELTCDFVLDDLDRPWLSWVGRVVRGVARGGATTPGKRPRVAGRRQQQAQAQAQGQGQQQQQDEGKAPQQGTPERVATEKLMLQGIANLEAAAMGGRVEDTPLNNRMARQRGSFVVQLNDGAARLPPSPSSPVSRQLLEHQQAQQA